MSQSKNEFHDDSALTNVLIASKQITWNHLKQLKLHIASDLEPRDAFDQTGGTLYYNKSGWHDLLSLNNGASRAFHKSLIGQ